MVKEIQIPREFIQNTQEKPLESEPLKIEGETEEDAVNRIIDYYMELLVQVSLTDAQISKVRHRAEQEIRKMRTKFLNMRRNLANKESRSIQS